MSGNTPRLTIAAHGVETPRNGRNDGYIFNMHFIPYHMTAQQQQMEVWVTGSESGEENLEERIIGNPASSDVNRALETAGRSRGEIRSRDRPIGQSGHRESGGWGRQR